MSLLDFVPSINYDFRLTKKELFRFKRVFDAFDADMLGTISCRHLNTALRACAMNISNKDVARLLEREDWLPTTQIDLRTFFILVARMKRDLSTQLGANYLEIDAAQTRRAFCGMYTDTSGKINTEGLNYTIPTEILREKLVDKGPEPLSQNLYDKFRLEMPPDCLVDDGLSFDSEALCDFIQQEQLEDVDTYEEVQQQKKEKAAEDEERMEKRVSLHRQEEEDQKTGKHKSADHRDGWMLPGELLEEGLKNISDVAHKTSATLDHMTRDIYTGLTSTVTTLVPRELREELMDSYEEITKQAGEYAGMVGLDSMFEVLEEEARDYEVLFPKRQRHIASSTASTSSGSLSEDTEADSGDEKDNIDFGEYNSQDDSQSGSEDDDELRRTQYSRPTLRPGSKNREGEDGKSGKVNYDDMFIVDDSTNKTVAEHLAEGKLSEVRKALRANKHSRHKDPSHNGPRAGKSKNRFKNMMMDGVGDHMRQGLGDGHTDSDEEEVGYLGSPSHAGRHTRSDL